MTVFQGGRVEKSHNLVSALRSKPSSSPSSEETLKKSSKRYGREFALYLIAGVLDSLLHFHMHTTYLIMCWNVCVIVCFFVGHCLCLCSWTCVARTHPRSMCAPQTAESCAFNDARYNEQWDFRDPDSAPAASARTADFAVGPVP